MISLLRILPVLLLLCLPAAARQPNVILIMADDLGYLDLGCYGHPVIRTPNLDRLAADGVRLTDFHSGATVCTPSRMALLTGIHPTRLGWTQGVVGFKMGSRDGLHPDALTLAEIYKSGSYATGISGKWHIGHHPDTRPHRQGFDHAYYLPLSNNQTNEIWLADEIVEKPFENRLLTERITTNAIRFVRENKDRPFFLYIPYTAPHFPVEPHPEWQGRSKFGKYGDVIEELDSRIGDLLRTIGELGLTQHTIVVFTSDNGPNPGEGADCKPYRGEKWSALEGGTRVPCIVSWPGTLPAGSTTDALVSAVDLLPTLSRACGIDWKGKTSAMPIDGIDQWDVLLGKSKSEPRTDLLLWHGMDGGPQALRSGDWKWFGDRRHALEGMGTKRATPEQSAKIAPYRENLVENAPNPPFLFNLDEDPGETIDLSETDPEKSKAMKARAGELAAQLEAAPSLPLHTPEKP
jgi:arylsulfatase A-like enzyme